MGPFKYKVIAIEGEYATIKRIDNETADTILIALALLPEGTDIGTELLWENLESVSYTHLTLPTNREV